MATLIQMFFLVFPLGNAEAAHPPTTRTAEDPIYFYDSDKPYFEFTGFSEHPIEYGGLIYPTAEHLFQAFKFMETDPALAECIRRLPTPSMAQEVARNQAHRQRTDWLEVNVDMMDKVLKRKFSQYRSLRCLLRDTGSRELIEDSPIDWFWGIGDDGLGRNELVILRDLAKTQCQYPGCTKNVWKDPDGSYSSFCGNTHRFAIVSNPKSRSPTCKKCNVKPAYIENGRALDFCGRRCAQGFNNNGQCPGSLSRDIMCNIPGCRSRAFIDADGNVTKFCSIRHRLAAVQRGLADICLFCKQMPIVEIGGKQSDFCSKHCSIAALSIVPTILEVPIGNAKYAEVEDQFTRQWKHSTQKPTVVKLWRIYGDQSVLNRFSQYQLEVERRTGKDGGNTRRRFHGSVRECTLGDTSCDGNLCAQKSCNICRIIESSFQHAHAGERTNFGRFGEGIYTSATSSKANDYHGGSASPNRAMLLNDVVMGKAIRLTMSDESLMAPPAGYDSVIGEPGGDLNYDECIVYKNDAVRASFLIVYK